MWVSACSAPVTGRAGIGVAETCHHERPATSLADLAECFPAHALLALWAAHHLLVPVHGEVGRLERAIARALPGQVPPLRPDEIDAVPLTGGHQQIGAHVGRVGQVLRRSQIFGSQCGLVRDALDVVGVDKLERALGRQKSREALLACFDRRGANTALGRLTTAHTGALP